MLQLTSAGKRFGHKLLFEKVDWQITPGERTGLVGGNGTGKSTLLRILAGLDSLDDGSIDRTGGMTFGYLPQDGLQLRGRTVFEECLSAFDETRALEQKIQALNAQLADLSPTSAEYALLSEQLSRSDAQFHALDGYTIEARVGIVLSGLGFSREDWSRQTEEFSGGWQMRIALAKLLLEKPDLLLLDEPTNHLDLEARNWLEGYLHSYPHAYILISHDRFFLDVATNKIAELWNRRLYTYTGNYEKYLQQKQERLAQLEAAYQHQREHIEHLEGFINRFRAQATKARQVQSRVKELEHIERIELPPQETTIHFTFPQPPPSGRTVVEATQVTKSYAKQVFSDVRFTIERGERIALVGPNGAGKSTLMRLLAAIEPPTSGDIRFGHNVALQYFAQDQYKELDADARMLDDIGRSAPRIPQTELRSLLGCFLFSGDDVYKHLGVLSGGERNRYALARLLVSPANFLLLDEPTNHLDMRAKEVLLEAIRNFTGTVVFVSHDRAFIDALATRVIEIRDGAVHVYTGNYEDYLWQTSRQAESQRAQATPPAVQKSNGNLAPSSAPIADAPDADAARAKRINPIRLRQMQERCTTLEEEIPRTEAAIQTTEQQMAIFISAEQYQMQTAQLETLRAEHAAMLSEWEELMTQLEEQAAIS